MGSLPNLHELCNKDDHSGQHQKYGHYQPTNDRTKSQNRHQKVFKSRSNGNSAHIYDDMMLEHMTAYSPISSRSTRNLTHNIIRRRDSMSSSIGATSVRRLITVVRNTHSRYGPVYNKKLLVKNLIVICVSHILFSSSFYPFLALQSSVSVWHTPVQNGKSFLPANINVGSLLLSIGYLFAALSTLLGPTLVHKLGTNWLLYIFYIFCLIFYAGHFFPILYILVPVYVGFGIIYGPICVSRITFLMTLSSKLSYSASEEDEDSKYLRKTCVIRRVARSFQAAQDFGLILGSVLAALIISLSFNSKNMYNSFQKEENNTLEVKNLTLGSEIRCGNNFDCCGPFCLACNCSSNCLETNEVQRCCEDYNETCRNEYKPKMEEAATIFDYTTFMDNIFDVDELGDRLCGSNACPSKFVISYNSTEYNLLKVLPKNSADILTGVFIALCIIALIVAASGLDKIRLVVHQDPLERPEGLAALKAVRESFKDFRLQLAAPLAVFVGMEQAFMFSDFTKSYVVCTLGIERVNLVFLCMGLLQSIAACTLSMLLRTIKRWIVIAVGLVFHGCLILVQFLWKPSADDPALFYVISAAWGVCNAIWEMLIFTLLTGLYTDNFISAFTHSYFFRHIGTALAFALHGLLCNWLKLYLLAGFMIISSIPFTWLEVKLESIRKDKNISRL